MNRLYLYAIVGRAPVASLGSGLADEPLTLVEAGDVVAVVGAMGGSLDPTADALRGHDAVVRRLAGLSEAIVPARFGTVRDAPALAEWLATAAEGLGEALRLVTGREQMTLHVFDMGGPDMAPRLVSEGGDAPLALPRPQPSAHLGEPEARRETVGPGARYLAERRRHWRRKERLPELEPLRPWLDALVAAERVEPRATPPLRASVYHLIERGRSAEYRDAVESNLEVVAGVRLRVSGPWAPYAFAPMVV
jgi:hypothetical protein